MGYRLTFNSFWAFTSKKLKLLFSPSMYKQENRSGVKNLFGDWIVLFYQVMVFHIIFMLVLFHNKKCCNCINLFSCNLWDLFVMGLVLSGEYLMKIAKGYVRSTCRKLKNQCISQVISRLGQPTRWPARWTDSWDFKCNSYTLHPHYPQNSKEVNQIENPRKVSTTPHLVRESYSSLSEN